MKVVYNLLYACIIFAVIGVIWMLLEVIYYGAVQNRIVDNIMSVFIFISIYYNIKYYREIE